MSWNRTRPGPGGGAAGVTVLNAITYLDMAVRARPASDTPSWPALGKVPAPLAAAALGALAMAGSDGPARETVQTAADTTARATG
jgi:hypothetical protein